MSSDLTTGSTDRSDPGVGARLDDDALFVRRKWRGV
jgi:hypothetical protein